MYFLLTDSVCFLSKPGHPEPPTGQFLGDLTNQLEDDYGPGSFCTEFVSGGPKNYAYRVAVQGDLQKIKTVIKVRGITINSSCSDTITFERLKEMVLNNVGKTDVNIPSQIARLKGWKIVTRPTSKTWQVCLTKRRRIDTSVTTPYGFTGSLLDNNDHELLDALEELYNE